MFYFYTEGEHKNMPDRFSIHQINAPNSCYYLSQSFVAEKSQGTMQKLFMKKMSWEKKMDKCPRYLKQWVLRCTPEKRESRIR